MKEKIISIAKDFSMFPAGRYEKDGPFTGEGFRKKILAPALIEFDKIIIELDNPLGYGSSFLEEAFGGLIRSEGFSLTDIKKKLELRSKSKSTLCAIEDYLQKANSQL